MKIKQEIFADGIGKINFSSGMVRFDYETIQPNAASPAEAKQTAAQVIMPLQGFLASFNSAEQLIEQLLEKGVLTARKKEEKAPAAPKTPAKRGRKKKTAAEQ